IDIWEGRVEAGLGDDVVREWRTRRGIGLRRRVRIENSEVLCPLAEITSPEVGRRHAVVARITGALRSPFIVEKVEQLVALDGATDVTAENIEDVQRLHKSGRAEILVSALQMLIGIEPPAGAMQLVCAGLGLQSDCSAASHPLIRIH